MPEIETPPAPVAPPAAAPPAPPTDWRAGLPEELRAEKTLEGFKDIGSLAKSYVETKRFIGEKLPEGVSGEEVHAYLRDAIRVPKPDAPAEEWAAVFSKLGRPESPDKYAVKEQTFPPELGITVDPEGQKAFLGVAHAAGLTTAQVQKVLDWYGQYTIGQVDGQVRQTGEARKTAEAALKQEWGSAYQRNTGLARATVATLFGRDPELAAAIEDAGNNVALVKGLVRIGEILHERGEIRGDEVSAGRTVTEIQAEIDRIKATPNVENDPTAGDRILNLTRELLAARDRK